MPDRGSDRAEPLSQLVRTRSVYTVLLLGLLLPLGPACREVGTQQDIQVSVWRLALACHSMNVLLLIQQPIRCG